VTRDGTFLVVGSGPSSAIVALTLSERLDHRVTVLDLGGRLEDDNEGARVRLATRNQSDWEPADLALVSQRAAPVRRGSVPQKRAYGSDYPFRDLGQITGIRGRSPGTNTEVVSSAYGGFSTVWGAQVMPFSRSTFERWPISWQDMEPHYRAVLDEVPLAAETDDLADEFPLINRNSDLPPLGPRAVAVLRRYAQHRTTLRASGVTVGRARLAFRAQGCNLCGLCMTGCPHSLIYSAAQTMERIRHRPNVTVHGSLLVERIGQVRDQVVAWCRNVQTGQRHEFRADRLFVGAGGIGTTRLVLASMAAPPRSIDFAESAQFVLPFLSARAVPASPAPGSHDFALNQFNVLLHFDDEAYTTSQVHCYPYNDAILDALPAPLRARWAAPARDQLVRRRLTVAFGYLPSWASPTIRATVGSTPSKGLPSLDLMRSDNERPPLLGQTLRRLLRAAPSLDLWPLLTHASLSGPGKSYHFGSSFPHRSGTARTAAPSTDRWGRLPDWTRIHLIDVTVLPSLPSTTFTLTVMANARRIASVVSVGLPDS
jgi:ferredoxin